MKALVAKIRFYWTYLRMRFVFAWQIETAYAGNVVGELFSTTFYNITFIIFLNVLLSKIKLLGGYSFNDMLVLTLMAQVAFYTALTFTWESAAIFIKDIKDGVFDIHLLKPLSLIFQVMTLGLRPFSGFFFSIPPLSIYVFLIIKNNAFHPTIQQVGAGLLSLMTGLLLLHFYRYAFSMIAFKAKEIRNIMKMLDLFGDFGAYPYEMYHQPLLTVVMFVAPLLPAAGIPASYFLGKSTTITPFLMQLALLAFFIIACSIGWKKGLKAYESASS